MNLKKNKENIFKRLFLFFYIGKTFCIFIYFTTFVLTENCCTRSEMTNFLRENNEKIQQTEIVEE
jgi:hypothetical protein